MSRLIMSVLLVSMLIPAASIHAKESTVSETPDACTLIEKSVVEKVAGSKVTFVKEPAEGPYLGSCRYSLPDGNDVALVSILKSEDVAGYVDYVRQAGGIEFKPAPSLGAGAMSSTASVILPLKSGPFTALVAGFDIVKTSNSLQMTPSEAKHLELASHVKR